MLVSGTSLNKAYPTYPRRPHRDDVRAVGAIFDYPQVSLSDFPSAPGQPDEALPDGGASRSAPPLGRGQVALGGV